MDMQALNKLVSQGLSAMQAGGEVAATATDEISKDATHPALKQALEQGNEQAKQWQQRLDQAVAAAGPGDKGKNEILEAHYEVSRQIRAEAKDENARDLGIVAAGQLALHYWIAAFGTMKAYTGKLGMSEVEQAMAQSTEEAKQADLKHTEIAQALLAA